MRSTLNRVHVPRNPERDDLPGHVARVQRRGTLNGTPLNDGVRARYDIDPRDTVEAVVCALILVPLSIACVVIVGMLRAVGSK